MNKNILKITDSVVLQEALEPLYIHNVGETDSKAYESKQLSSEIYEGKQLRM